MMDLDNYIGIPYRNLGRTRKAWDCWGMVRVFYKDELGIRLPTLGGYADSEDGEDVENTVRKEASTNWIKVDTPKPYDVVVFNMAGNASHVGVMLGGGKFLHALKGRLTCVERINGLMWANRIHGFYRMRKTA